MRVVTCLLVLLASASFVWAAGAGPSTKDPVALLPAQAENQTLVDEAAKTYDKAREMVVELMSKRDQKNYAAIRGETVGEAHALLLKLTRLAQRLRLSVEPAGADLELRSYELSRRLGQVILEMKQLPAVREGLARTFTGKVLPLVAKRQQQIPALEKLCKANQWDTAEQELYQILDELETYGCWYDAPEREKMFSPFNPATRTINETLFAQRTDAAKQRVDLLRQKPGPTLDDWLKDSSAAAASIRQTGSASVEGKPLNGPAAFTHFVRQLTLVEQAALRLQAAEWWRERLNSRTFPEGAALAGQFEQKSPEMLQRLAGFIEADAARAQGGEVDSLYLAYLTEVPNAGGLFATDQLAKVVQPALTALAAKNPALAAQAALYERATGDLIRWRKRIAAVQAQARAKDFPPLVSKIVPLCMAEGDFPAILGRGQTLEQVQLAAHAPAIMGRMSKAVGVQAQVGQLRSDETGALTLTRYAPRLFTRATGVKQALAGYLPLVEYDLLANPAAPPLSLTAATALVKARRGDVEAAGGAIKQVELRGVMTRALAPTPSDAASIRLGPLPVEALADSNPATQIYFECELEPAWVQHELFFIPLR